MKVFISADIEGVNNIAHWDETDNNGYDYNYFRKQMTEEVKRACIGAYNANNDLKNDSFEILIKDAHDSARNLILTDLPEYVKLHRGWEGGLCSMMGGLDSTFDAVIFIGYHSPSRSDGNPLSHTMNLKIHHVKINDEIASEFMINSLYASSLHVPIAFLSGDEKLTEIAKKVNENIETVATKKGVHGAVISLHPNVTNQQIEDTVKKSLEKDLKKNIVRMPKSFDVEIQYRKPTDAYHASFYPGCTLLGTDRILFHSNDYNEED